MSHASGIELIGFRCAGSSTRANDYTRREKEGNKFLQSYDAQHAPRLQDLDFDCLAPQGVGSMCLERPANMACPSEMDGQV
jgi:hypothetical protein